MLWDNRECPADHLVRLMLKTEIRQESTTTQMQLLLGWECLSHCESVDTASDPLWLVLDARENRNGSALPMRSSNKWLRRGDPSRMSPYQEISTTGLKPLKKLCTNYEKYQSQGLQGRDCADIMQNFNSDSHRYPYDKPQSISLKGILEQASSLPYGLPLDNRMHLAKELSEAVLQHHSTPWSDEGWQSENITFFGEEDLKKDPLKATCCLSQSFVSFGDVSKLPLYIDIYSPPDRSQFTRGIFIRQSPNRLIINACLIPSSQPPRLLYLHLLVLVFVLVARV